MPTRMAGGRGGASQPEPEKKSPCDGKDAVTQAAMRLLIANGQRDLALSLGNHDNPHFARKEAKTNSPNLFSSSNKFTGGQFDSYTSIQRNQDVSTAYTSAPIAVPFRGGGPSIDFSIKFYPDRVNSVGIVKSNDLLHILEAGPEVIDETINSLFGLPVGTNHFGAMHELNAHFINSSLPCE